MPVSASAEGGSDLRGRRPQLRYELDGAHQGQPCGGALHRERCHDVALAVQKAALTNQLAIQVRNRLVEAYQEVMRMPV